MTVKTQSGVEIDTTRGKRPLSFVVGQAAAADPSQGTTAVGAGEPLPSGGGGAEDSRAVGPIPSTSGTTAMSAEGSVGVQRFGAPTFLMLLDQVI